MPVLDEATLKNLQKYVEQLEKERGFEDDTIIEKCLLLGEELGELFKAIRKSEKIGIDKSSVSYRIDEELADILIYICAIANRTNVDLETAFREKEQLNKKRKWE